jgi:putative OmpL-like beta-barrel porin-2
MNRSLVRSLRLSVAGFAALAVGQLGLTVSPASAQAPPPPDPPPPAAATAAPPPAAPTSPLTAPSLTGPLTLSTTPYNFDAAGLGTLYVSGVASGLFLGQTDPTLVFLPNGTVKSDHAFAADASNVQGIIQKIDGVFQFYVQAGLYSLPSLGLNYNVTQKAISADTYYFGLMPVGYAKIVPTDTFNVMVGKLPTLIGAEYTFTFQNMNIERGLLWNQEPAISRGIQGNLTTGPVAWAVSLNDGLYSGNYDWITGSATWTIDPANTLAVVGGGNFGQSGANTVATPFFQNNEDIFNVIYTYNNAPWTVTPYFQYTSVPKNPAAPFFATKGADTWGLALLANYAFADTPWNLAGRVEYISSSGSVAGGNANVLGYGPGSSAWSLTLTPTYQQGIFFARVEGSVVGLSGTTAGSAFGKAGTTTTQGRLVFETGVMF